MTKLQSLRKTKKLSQFELSIKTKIPMGSLQAYEQGRKNIDGAKIRTLLDISKALDCRIEDILEDESICQDLNKLYS